MVLKVLEVVLQQLLVHKMTSNVYLFKVELRLTYFVAHCVPIMQSLLVPALMGLVLHFQMLFVIKDCVARRPQLEAAPVLLVR